MILSNKRRSPFFLSGAISAVILSSHVSAGATQAVLVKDGAAEFIVVYAERSAEVGEAIYAPDLPKESKVLAEVLAEYVSRTSGAEVKLYAEKDAPAAHHGTVLYLGATAKGTEFVGTKGEMEEDEFFIAFPDAKTILIAGQFQHGIEWGTYEFIERYLGVRWLFAGELGTHVPTTMQVVIPRQEVHVEPAYPSRAISFDHNRPELTHWARLCRLRRRVRHGHYLGVLFHPSKFLKSNPEFFPLQRGVRARPIDPVTFVAWQPCFTAPKVVETIAPHVAQFFRGTKPRTSTISLGVNDNGGHCECESCLVIDGDRKTPGGLDNRSESYYQFCNELVAEVHRLLPARKELRFGLLAYSNVIVPPEERLHPSLIPFLTRDRMVWADEETRQHGHSENERWQEKAAGIGWYDYIYGRNYSVPRVYFHTMQAYLQYGQANKVEHYYAEAYIADDYREGPKYWLAMKLLWNPELDIEAALDEWYTAAAGKAAAPYLRQYFARWETFWTCDIHDSDWFQDMKRSTYCQYSDTRYFLKISSAILREQMELLRAAEREADSRLGRKRVQMWVKGLENAKVIVSFRNAIESLSRRGSELSTREVLSHDKFDGKDGQLEKHRLGGVPTEGWSTWKSNYSKATLTTDPQNGVTGGALFIDKMADKHTPSPTGTVFLKRVPVKPDQARWYGSPSTRKPRNTRPAGSSMSPSASKTTTRSGWTS